MTNREAELLVAAVEHKLDYLEDYPQDYEEGEHEVLVEEYQRLYDRLIRGDL